MVSGAKLAPGVPDCRARRDHREHNGPCCYPAAGQRAHEVSLCLADEIGKGGVHIDNCHWTGVFFLTLDQDAQGGTDFFRHRPSGTLRAPVYPEDWQNWPFDTVAKLWNDVIHPHTNDASKWDSFAAYRRSSIGSCCFVRGSGTTRRLASAIARRTGA